MKWGMVIDLEKCTGCQACTTACAMENTNLPGEAWQDVLFYHEGEYPTGQLKWLPRPCMHCEDPSCVHVCPTRATYKDPEDGLVLIDWDKCIGCKYGMLACPYGVRFFTDEPARVSPDIREAYPDEEKEWSPPYEMPEHKQSARTGVGVHRKGVVSKCTFCAHKIREAPEGVSDLDPDDPELVEYVPACVRTCAPTARYFGDLDNPESKVNQLIADKRGVRLLDHTGNRPQVYYLTGEGGAIPAFDDKQS